MEKIRCILFNRNKYREVFLFITILYSISYFTSFSTILNLFLLLWGGLLLVSDLFSTRIIFKSKKLILLMIFIVGYFITLIVNRDMGFFENAKIFLLTILQFFILFAFSEEDDEKSVFKHITIFSEIIVKVTFITSGLSLIIYILGINFEFKDFIIGVQNGMLNGIYTGANTAGPLAAISIAVSLLVIELKKKYAKIKFLWTNIIIQFIFICMTNSRATMYCIMVFAIILALFYFKDYKNKSVSVISVIVIYFVSKIINDVLYYINRFVNFTKLIFKFIFNKITNSINSGEIGSNIPNIMDGLDGSSGAVHKEIHMGFFNGRAQLWECGIEIFRDNVLFGVGSRNVAEVALKYHSLSELPGVFGGGMHNIIIQILVSNGLVGFLSILVFAIICLFEFIKYFVTKGYIDTYFRVVLIVFSMLVMLVVNNMAEANILYAASYMSTVFWTYLGFGIFIINKCKSK